MAYLGGQGIYFQRKESAHTKWSGDRILGIYQIFLILCLAAELGWFAVSMNALVALRENADTVLADGLYNSPPEFSSMEVSLEKGFIE